MSLIPSTTQFHRLAAFPMGWWIDSPAEGEEGEEAKQELQELRDFRMELIREELNEYLKAEDEDDLVEVIDGLLDIIVVAWGTILSYIGEKKAYEAAWEVAVSNLTKVNGSLGPIARREDGKVLKPEGWRAPNIAGVIDGTASPYVMGIAPRD